MTGNQRFDAKAILASVDLVAVVGRFVPLKKNGHEYHGCCPFHDERTPSFTVNADKGFVHCFGCGAHHDAIGFIQRITSCSFVEACKQLGGQEYAVAQVVKEKIKVSDERRAWVPLLPVPDYAGSLLNDEGRVSVFNPKKMRFWSFAPSRVDAYHDADGKIVGYVLRTEIKGEKITPTITWCVGPDGVGAWCVRPMPSPRSLFNLNAITAKPEAPVLIVEGEKCASAADAALPMYACTTFCGGGKAISRTDFTPLMGRDVVLWPDADKPGFDTMLGYEDYTGRLHDGVAQYCHRAGAKSIRVIMPANVPKGWDLADALDPEKDNWSVRQLIAWAKHHVRELEVVIDPERRVA